jgi:hypothetical protein
MKTDYNWKWNKHGFFIFFLMLIAAILITQGCYSVRISNVNGVPEPNPANFEEGFYRGKAVISIDTTINLKLLENEVMVLETCPEGCFQTVEYRVTLGDVLFSGITFGKMRRIRVKYVCLKESNE